MYKKISVTDFSLFLFFNFDHLKYNYNKMFLYKGLLSNLKFYARNIMIL